MPITPDPVTCQLVDTSQLYRRRSLISELTHVVFWHGESRDVDESI